MQNTGSALLNPTAGSMICVRGIWLTAVPVTQIRVPSPSELIHSRMMQLKHGFNSVEQILRDPQWRGDPITLNRTAGLCEVVDGRHRVSLAHQMQDQGYFCVWARLLP